MDRWAFVMQVASVSASSRHGSTTLRRQTGAVSGSGSTPTFSATMIGQFYGHPAR